MKCGCLQAVKSFSAGPREVSQGGADEQTLQIRVAPLGGWGRGQKLLADYATSEVLLIQLSPPELLQSHKALVEAFSNSW